MKRIFVVFAIVTVLPLFTNGFYTKENSLKPLVNYGVRDERITCVKDNVSRIIAGNREIQQWLKEVERIIGTLVNEGKKCAAMSNPMQSTCYLKLESTGLSELGRLVNIITRNMVDDFDKITDIVVECLLTMENSPLNIKSSDDFQITNEQMKCIGNVLSIILKHNRDLQWWFEDIGKTLLSLIAEARDCASISGSERTICIIKLKIQVSVEVQRIAEILPKDKQAIPGIFKGFIEGCFL